MLHDQIGAHLRLLTTYEAIAHEALSLGIKHFQFFLVPQKSKAYLMPTTQDAAAFKALREQFKTIVIHTSYWINLASGDKHIVEKSRQLLLREAETAVSLGIDKLILHPGSAKKHISSGGLKIQKERGLNALAHSLEWYYGQEIPVEIVLENNAHGGTTLCSNFNDFYILQRYLGSSRKLSYCLDLAHAFVYGYNMGDTNKFVQQLESKMGIDNICLVHLNDTHEKFGSRCDSHTALGEGNIGRNVIRKLVTHKSLQDKVGIIELPSVQQEKTAEVLAHIRRWL